MGSGHVQVGGEWEEEGWVNALCMCMQSTVEGEERCGCDEDEEERGTGGFGTGLI